MRTLLAVALLATGCASATSTSSRPETGTITGQVFRAPTCPVERVGSPCPPSPVAGGQVDAVRGSSIVARTTTDGTGAFRLSVAAGGYTVVAYNTGGLRTSAQANVVVRPGATSTVTLTVDSGIR